MTEPEAVVIGAGFAGVEAANVLSSRGHRVRLCEMKPLRFSPAHKNPNLCEVVCSNSFKAERTASASGLLKAEMEKLGSLTVACAKETRVPAGGALAVDRDIFSALITQEICSQENIELRRGEIAAIPDAPVVIIAAGPLISDALADSVKALTGGFLSFFDAEAPIVSADSVDMERAFVSSRYDRGGDDYINCPLDKAEYELFIRELTGAGLAQLHDFDRREIYEGCMPIEVLASRGADAARFGPMKPVGLVDPRTGHRPWANVQLRAENRDKTMYNLVGFQTNLRFDEQKRVFGLIPALAGAVYERYGVMHRNSFLRSPGLLLPTGALLRRPAIFFAGQITGVEGYMESADSGITAGLNAALCLEGRPPFVAPPTTMTGALQRYISQESGHDFQPMGAAFGLLPPLEEHIRDKGERYARLAERALEALDAYCADNMIKAGD